jgi:hypothetical protein
MTDRAFVQDSLSAENTFGDPIQVDANDRYAVSISGTFVATVTIQRRFDNQNWRDIESYTVETEKDGIAANGQMIRLGIKTGDYTSGTVVCRIGMG